MINTRKSGIRRNVFSLTAISVVAVVLVAITFANSLGAGGPAYVGTDAPTTPEEWESGGYAEFANQMADLYRLYDGEDQAATSVRVSKKGGISAAGVPVVSDAEVSDSAGSLRTSALALLQMLGYDCVAEGDGIRATHARRGDEVLVLPDSISVNGADVVAGAGVDERGIVQVDVKSVAEALGYEAIPSSDGVLTLRDPWQTARVVALGQGVDDPDALRVVSGPDDMMVLQYATGREAREAALRMKEGGKASWVGPDRIVSLCESDDGNAEWEPAEALSWGNDFIGSPDMQVSLVRKYGSVDKIPEVTVAVIDTGVDMDHELLADRLVDGHDFVEDDADPDATDPHGSHVSGIVANNTTENVRIMPLRAGEQRNISETAAYSSIEYAISHGADVINMSFGGEYSSESWLGGSVEQMAIRDAERAGIVTVAAHGNDARETSSIYPSSDDAVISVSALSEDGSLADFSNSGAPVDFSAPGTNIYSSTLDGGYGNESGTSMAAPFVAAASALALSDDAGRSVDDVKELLKRSALDLGEDGWDKLFGYGCVSLLNLAAEGADTDVARIGANGYPTLQAAFSAASEGDVITLVKDVELTETIAVPDSVTLRPARKQAVTRAEGFAGPMFEVGGALVLGDGTEESARELRLDGGTQPPPQARS